MSTLTLAKLYTPIKKDLDSIKELMNRENENTDSIELKQVAQHVKKSSGKMIRAACCIYAFDCGKNTTNKNKLYKLASVIETIHLASLVHDDIIDESDIRRNSETVYKKFGRNTALVSGTFFYAKAVKQISDIGSLEILEDISQCVQRLCEGELNQIRDIRTCTIEQYLNSIHGKTSILFESACKNAALLSDGNRSELSEYGRHLGTIFQITDDYLDLFGNEDDLAKNTGQDFDAGIISLPYIMLYQILNDTDKQIYLDIKSLAELKETFKSQLIEVKKNVEILILDYVKMGENSLTYIDSIKKRPLTDILTLVKNRIY